ncbi:MAG: hypothetical protein AB7F41_14290 [Methylocystis sp.]|uniref:hypothetical protein n=1 Tax=Methylocystis sp. TaxID=1911079 RepID=UPI003D14A017
MAVSLRDRSPPPKADNIETRARYAWHDIEHDWRVASPRTNGAARRQSQAASDRNFKRVERFFYFGAAALVIFGTAIVVGSAFWGELPQNIDPDDLTTPQKIATPGPAHPAASASSEAQANLRSHEQPVSIVAGPVEPTPTQEPASSTPDGAESAQAADAANPLASSIAGLDLEPEFLNDDIAGRRRRARRGAESGATETAKAAPESEPAGSDASTRKCYVRISGRVQNSGVCQISRQGGAVTFQYSGQTLTLSPVRGKTWSAKLGGKNIGNVYKSGGSCWGSRSTYICDRGG